MQIILPTIINNLLPSIGGVTSIMDLRYSQHNLGKDKYGYNKDYLEH